LVSFFSYKHKDLYNTLKTVPEKALFILITPVFNIRVALIVIIFTGAVNPPSRLNTTCYAQKLVNLLKTISVNLITTENIISENPLLRYTLLGIT
jgi:hypothetical protein